MAVQVFVNGRRSEAEAPVSVGDLLAEKKIRPEVCSVALNGTFLKREQLAEAVAQDGDKIEIMIQLAGGER